MYAHLHCCALCNLLFSAGKLYMIAGWCTLYIHYKIYMYVTCVLPLQGEDDYMSSLGLYDGYDSYNDSGDGTTDEDENLDGNLLPQVYSHTKPGLGGRPRGPRYFNGKDMSEEEMCFLCVESPLMMRNCKSQFCSTSVTRLFDVYVPQNKLFMETLSGSVPSPGFPLWDSPKTPGGECWMNNCLWVIFPSPVGLSKHVEYAFQPDNMPLPSTPTASAYCCVLLL